VKVKLIRCTTLSMVLGLTFASAHAEVIFADKFEAYSLAGFGTAQEGWAITNSVIRSGNYAAVQTLPPVTSLKPSTNLSTAASQRFSIGGGTGFRSRSETKFKGHQGDLAPGKSYSIRFSNRVTNPQGNAHFFQIHKRRARNDPSGKQPLALKVKNGHWVLAIHSSSKGKEFNLGKIDTRRYTDWQINVKLSSGRDGHVEVLRNGHAVANYNGPNDFQGNGNPYVKFGLYRSAKARTGGSQTAYYDNVRISGN
jgi:hypothetical protein